MVKSANRKPYFSGAGWVSLGVKSQHPGCRLPSCLRAFLYERAGIVERTLGGVTSRYVVVALGSVNDFARLSKVFVKVNTALG
jgi:hypothetical protein